MLDLQTKQSKVHATAGNIKSHPLPVCFCKALSSILAMLLLASSAWGFETDEDSQIGSSTKPKKFIVYNKVGINKPNPEEALDVDGNGKFSGEVQAQKFVGGGAWDTNGSSINYSNGNVGIGTSSPEQKLHVNGSVRASAFIGDGSGLTNINSWQTVSEGINYPGGKRVGINTSTPQDKFDIRGNMRLGETALGGFREGTINRVLKVEDNRKVSIGPNNSNSSEALSVDGDTTISGKLTVNSNLVVASNLVANTANFDTLYVANKIISADHTHLHSDLRLKENIKPIENVLPKLQQTDGVYFDWKQPKHDAQKGRQIGVIAQAIEAQFPELVKEGADGYKSVAYSNIVAVLIQAVKELKRDNDLLAERIRVLEEEVE
jgi:cytoskeletal protein CcmA (bactofilin family)